MIMGKMEYHGLFIVTTDRRNNGKSAWRTNNETIESKEVVDGKADRYKLLDG